MLVAILIGLAVMEGVVLAVMVGVARELVDANEHLIDVNEKYQLALKQTWVEEKDNA